MEKFFISKEEFKNIINSDAMDEIIRQQSKEDNVEESIGHGIEHTTWVVMRMLELSQFMKDNAYPNIEKEPIDLKEVIYAGMLHDIGNVVTRAGHNHFAYGIITGNLDVEDIIRLPFETKQYGFVTSQQRENIFKSLHILKAITNDKYDTLTKEEKRLLKDAAYLTNKRKKFENFSKNEIESVKARINNLLSNEEKIVVAGAVQLCMEFDVAYHGSQKIFKKDDIMDITWRDFSDDAESCTKDYIAKRFRGISRQIIRSAASGLFFKPEKESEKTIYKITRIEYNKELQKITKRLQEEFKDEPEKLRKIGRAIQEHCIDYTEQFEEHENRRKRFRPETLLGQLINDADKDASVGSFIYRAIAYAEKALEMDSEDAIINVFYQMWSRFKEPYTNEEDIQNQPLPFNVVEKDQLVTTKGVLYGKDAVKYYQCNENSVLKEFITESKEKMLYVIKQEPGDDVYSTIDAENTASYRDLPTADKMYKKTLGLREKFIEKTKDYADTMEHMSVAAEEILKEKRNDIREKIMQEKGISDIGQLSQKEINAIEKTVQKLLEENAKSELKKEGIKINKENIYIRVNKPRLEDIYERLSEHDKNNIDDISNYEYNFHNDPSQSMFEITSGSELEERDGGNEYTQILIDRIKEVLDEQNDEQEKYNKEERHGKEIDGEKEL